MHLSILARCRTRITLDQLRMEFKTYHSIIDELLDYRILQKVKINKLEYVETDYRVCKFLGKINSWDYLREWWEGNILRI
ncbi:MAG: hypothetical protein INQ03_09190 [Candidatus Heimdallarchaeota archaeon]|nr:hypothetical protein [Candidatus Heimdallarchaeota archaeon]